MNEGDMAKLYLNWYVLQTTVGREKKLLSQLSVVTEDGAMYDASVPECEIKKKYEGRWHIERVTAFPGYVFFRSDDIEKVVEGLKCLWGFRRILKEDGKFARLKPGEAKVIRELAGADDVVEMSYGFIEKDRIIVERGPLEGYEGCIKKIDRHKRRAEIELEIMGNVHRITCGLEILRKNESNESNESNE